MFPDSAAAAAAVSSVGRPPRADGPPVVASPPPEAATGPRHRLFQEDHESQDIDRADGDLIARLSAIDWFDEPSGAGLPDVPERTDTGPNLAVVVCFVVVAAIASAMVGVGLGYLTALL